MLGPQGKEPQTVQQRSTELVVALTRPPTEVPLALISASRSHFSTHSVGTIRTRRSCDSSICECR